MASVRHREAVVALLGEHPLFAPLEREVQQRLVETNPILYLEAGELLYRSGGAAEQIFILLAGALQIEYPPPDEARGIVKAMITAPGLLGEAQVLSGRPWSGTGVAMFPLTSLALSRRAFERLVVEHPPIGLELYRELACRFLNAIDNWKAEQSLEPSDNLARFLRSYATVQARFLDLPETPPSIPLGQAELGRATGLSRETINRVLRQWAREGRVEIKKSAVLLLDAPALAPPGRIDDRGLVQDLRDHLRSART